MRRLLVALIPLALLALSIPTAAVRAQSELCFSETGGYCIRGRFLQYWQQNGALSVFGYPVTEASDEVNRDTGQSYLTQWFQRNRFERHPENQAPYDVLLGRLGDDRLRQLGRNWQAEGRESGPQQGCLWFEQTGHNVCNQEGNLGFRSYWEANGLNDPRLNDYGQSLALFGLPLTAPKAETNSSGDTVLTQWFERARFEWHPNNPREYKVLLGLLGNEVRAQGSRTADVHIMQFAFHPDPVEITVGTTVKWTNQDDVEHTATHGVPVAPGNVFDSGVMAPGGSFAFTFTSAGEYPYYCRLHPAMRGMVRVRAP